MAVVMAVLATLVIFLIANTVPGDPALAQLGDLAASNPEFLAAFRAKWGLDLPLWERYFIFLKGLLHGDLGISIASQRPVLDDIAAYAPATIELATAGFLLSIVIGIPLGVIAAVRRDSGSIMSRGCSRSSACHRRRSGSPLSCWRSSTEDCRSRPARAARRYCLSAAGRHRPVPHRQRRRRRLGHFRDALAHLILPSIVLAAATLGLITRTTRASVLECMNQDYVRSRAPRA